MKGIKRALLTIATSLIFLILIKPSFAWYYKDFMYRLPIYVTENSGQDLYNFKLNLTIDTATLISQGYLQPDCDDIRFTYIDPTTGEEVPLQYWINKTTCNTSATKIYVNVPYIPANSTVKLYMYIGNPLATDNSTFDALLILYDDFYNLSNWDVFRFANDPLSECYLDTSTNVLYLTTAVGGRGCFLAYKEKIIPIYVKFRYLIGGGSGADGMAFAFDKDLSCYYTYGRATSGGSLALMAYDPTTGYVYIQDGYAVEFDNYQNGGDPTANHIAVIRTNTTDPYYHISYYDDSVTLYTEDNAWHVAEIWFDINTDSVINVTVDGNVVLSNVQLSPLGYFGVGFGAGTGGATNNHVLDWVYIYGLKYVDPWPKVVYGQLEPSITVKFDIHSPVNNTIYNTTSILVNATVYIYGVTDTVDAITLNIDGNIATTWYNVTNGTTITYTVILSEGRHDLYFNASVNTTLGVFTYQSDIITFYVDVTPPTITKIEPPAYIRLHYPYEEIPITVVVEDNYGVADCYVIDWFGVQRPCNTTVPASPSNVTEDYYTYYIISKDIAGNMVNKSYTIFFDISQGTPKIVSYSAPAYVPAVPFNISATIVCYDDWCDNVKVKLIAPPECTVSQDVVTIGDMEELESRKVNFTVSCTFAESYNFTINVTSANGNYDTLRFSMLPPYLNVYHSPESPTDNDNITIYVQPVGFGRSITIYYKVYIVRGGIPIILYNNTVTIPSDVVTPIAYITSDKTEAGDQLYYKVQVIDPSDFPIVVEKNVTISEHNPPQFIMFSLKYPTVAPHDDFQEFNVTVIDNTIVYKVELYVDYGYGYTLYSTKIVNAPNAIVSFRIQHNTSLIGKTIKMFVIAYDEFNNTAVSDVFSYKVVEDKPPVIIVDSPLPGAILNKSSIPLVIKTYDDFSQTMVCTIYNISKRVSNNTYELFNIKLNEGKNIVTINCTDTFNNIGVKNVTYIIDLTPPIIENVSYISREPYIVEFTATAKDNVLLDRLVYTVKAGNITLQHTIPLSGNKSTVRFTLDLRPYTNKIVSVILEAYDKAGWKFTLPAIQFAVTKVEVPGVPAVNLPPRITIKIEGSKLRIFIDDEASVAYCTLYYDSHTMSLGELPTKQWVFYNLTLPEGIYRIFVVCEDPHGLSGVSNIVEVYIPAKKKPVIEVFDIGAYTKPRAETIATLIMGIGMTVIGGLTGNIYLVVMGVSTAIFGPQIAEGIITKNLPMVVINTSLFGLLFLITRFVLRRITFI